MSALIPRQWRNWIFCHWEEDGTPVECFLDMVPLKKADAESISKTKNLQVGNIVGMGFDGAAPFPGKMTGVQARLKKHAPHAVFVLCHLLQLACMQAANSMTGIKHVYITLITLWQYFHYSPKRAESLKGSNMSLDYPTALRFLKHICGCHNFFHLSSVQIIIIPACCLLCVL